MSKSKVIQFLESCKGTPRVCVCDCKCSIKKRKLVRGKFKEKGAPQTDQTDCAYLMHKRRVISLFNFQIVNFYQELILVFS